MELVEGGERGDHGIIFKKVGPELRVVEGGFSSIPSQALAISNKFGLTFFLHSQGFCVSRTYDLVQACQSMIDSEDKCNAMDILLASVHLPSVQSLALSQDELVIAACTESKIHFYNVPMLVQKGQEASQTDTALLRSLSILDEKPGARVLAWNSVQMGVVLVLSKGGKLTVGPFSEQDLKEVAYHVEAADWSPDGEYICYITSDKNLHICKTDLSWSSNHELPREMFTDAVNGSSEACVDVLKWARVDSILISYVHIDLDGEEDDSKISVLVSSQGHFAKLQDHSKAKIYSFEGFFTSLDTSILPADSGPFTLSSYVSPWELLIVASRRSIDDHISLLGWCQEGGIYEVHKCELLDDRFTPRIELQACGDDNSVVGLAVDKTTTSIEVPKPNGDGGEKLRPGPVLFCMTLEGNLSLFSLARTGNNGVDVEVINNVMELPEANEVSLTHGLTRKSSGTKATGAEAVNNKSLFPETTSEEINIEDSQDTKTQEVSNEQIIKTSAAVSVTAGGTKLGPLDKRKEVITEDVQTQSGEPVKQKETSFSVEMTEQTKSEQRQKTPVGAAISQKQKEISFPVGMTEQTKSEHLQKSLMEAAGSQKLGPLEEKKDLTKHSLQTGAGVPLRQQEASVPVEQRSKPLFTAEKVTSARALSEMESEFIRELDEVKGMAMQIDNLMAVIEGKRKEKSGEAKPFFTKLLVEDIESKTRDLFRQCQSFREQLVEQGRSINDLGDEILQVDYGRGYVQSILEQAFDVRYQELWNKQTLHPEVAALRKRILQADKSLKQQVAELEEHLHNLELSQWRKDHHSKHSNGSSTRFEDKNFRFMQSLYDTVNTQMVIANQLAHRLAAQMEVLKLPVIPNEDMASSVDISSLKLQDMVLQEQSGSDFLSKTVSHLNLSSRTSDFSPIRAKGSMQTPMKVMTGASTRASLHDSTRRRRDSVDKLWVDVGAAKTTIKRAAPTKCFDEVSFSPNKGVVEADNKQLKSRTSRTSSARSSLGGARSMMTNNSAFSPVQIAERPLPSRTDILVEASEKAEDSRKPQYTDVWKVEPVLQGNTQVVAPATITNTVPWPSAALATTAHTASFSASKGTSFSRGGSGRIGNQNVSITNAEKQKALASSSFLSTPSLPQEYEPPSRTLSFGQATETAWPNAKTTIQLKAKPFETDVSKRDPPKKASFPFMSQETASKTASTVFPALSLSDLQQKAVPNVSQSKPTLVQQQGNLTKSEDLKVGKAAMQLVEMGPAALTAHVIPSAGQQGQTIKDTSKPEAHKTFANIKANASLSESSNANTVGYTNKALPVFGEQKISSPPNTVRSLSPEPAIGPASDSTVQAQSGFVSAVTSVAAIEPPSQLLGSLSSVTPFSSSLFQSPIAMSTTNMIQGVSASPNITPVASGVLSQTSSLFNVPSVPSVKPSEVLDKGIIPAEQQSIVNVSTSFIPSTAQEPPVSDEEDMEEVTNSINDIGSSSFTNFGLGSSSSSAGSQHASPFGVTSAWNQSNPPTSMSVPAGQLFKPASFSIPTQQSTAPTSTLFGSNLMSGGGGPFANASSGFGTPAQPSPAFGQPAQPGSSGQQVLGNSLGAFGQTRQIGSPFGVSSSPPGFGGASSGGFGSAASGVGFANAATGGGFASVAAGGGFANVPSGGGFAGLAGGGGFSGGGFAAFSGGSTGSPNPNPSGFGGFSGIPGNTNSSIFTQMRK